MCLNSGPVAGRGEAFFLCALVRVGVSSSSRHKDKGRVTPTQNELGLFPCHSHYCFQVDMILCEFISGIM